MDSDNQSHLESKQTVLYMVSWGQAYMLTTTPYKSNLVVVHGLCGTVQDLTWQGHVHAELLVVTNLSYKDLVAISIALQL